MKAQETEVSMVCPKVRVASVISGVGMYAPERVVRNEYFASFLETTDEWIQERSGIRERRWSEPGTGMSELAARACQNALENAGLSAGDIDGIVCGTVSPDYQFPSTACCIQERLGIKRGFAFDVSAACTGFLVALVTAEGMIRGGHCRHVLVVGGDLLSRVCNPQDRTTAVLFGDGAGAVVLSAASAVKQAGASDIGGGLVEGDGGTLRGVYASELCADGGLKEILYLPNGTATTVTPQSLAAGEHYMVMNGREVFKVAVRSLAEVSERVIKKAGFEPAQIDSYVSHQANKRILQSLAKHMNVSEDRVLMNVDRFGNTSAGSIPILLAESVASGKIKRGDLVLLSAVGGGMTWGAALIRW